MITEFFVSAVFSDESRIELNPSRPAHVAALKALSVVDLAVLSVLLKETAESVDRALGVAKSARSEAEAEQYLRDKGILR